MESKNICKFYGNNWLILKIVLMVYFLAIILMSIGMLGINWIFPVLILAILISIPFVLFFFLITAFFNSFYFDDDNKKLSKIFFNYNFCYNDISLIEIKEHNNLLEINAIKNKWRKLPLIIAIDAKYKENILSEFQKRFSDKIKVKNTSSILYISKILFFLISLIFIIYSYYYHKIHNRFSNIHILPIKKTITECEMPSNNKIFSFNNFTFSLPAEYSATSTNHFNAIYTGNKDAQIYVSLSPIEYYREKYKSFKKLEKWFNTNNSYVYYKKLFNEKFGILPLFLKGFILREWNNLKIYDIENNEFYGIIKIGKLNNYNMVDIILVDKKSNLEAVIKIADKKPIDENLIFFVINKFKINTI